MKELRNPVPFDIPTNVPIEQEDAANFIRAIQEFNPPDGWLQRVVSSSHFIDQPTFERDIDRLAEITKHEIQGPYAVMLSSHDKSDYWIYQQLLDKGLPEANLKHDMDSDESAEEYIKRGAGKSLTDLWLESVPGEIPIYTFDDFSITGAQVKEILSAFDRRKAPQYDNRFKAFLLYATDEANQEMTRSSIKTTIAAGKIRTLNDSLIQSDADFLEKLDEKVRPGKGGLIHPEVLFWTWYKAPDNIPPIFTGDGLPPLIRTERYKEPYKQHSA